MGLGLQWSIIMFMMQRMEYALVTSQNQPHELTIATWVRGGGVTTTGDEDDAVEPVQTVV